MRPGDAVWVKGVVTRVRPEGVEVALRVADRVGSTYAGSSGTNRVIDGVVRRVTRVPVDDVSGILLLEPENAPLVPGATTRKFPWQADELVLREGRHDRGWPR